MQPTRLTLFVLIWLVACVAGLVSGAWYGSAWLGEWGGWSGGLIGLLLGHLVGVVPSWLAHRWLLRELAEKSTAELWDEVASEPWDFIHTLALLELAARGEHVHGELPRIIALLASDDAEQRAFGWDALRLIFPDEARRYARQNPQYRLDDDPEDD